MKLACRLDQHGRAFSGRQAQVYENVTFGEAEHLRIADEQGMFERTVTLCSASKLFSLTGGKVLREGNLAWHVRIE